jgi:endonuclease/exonuclease/phosphatase family metal-dependent hydrolase
MSRHHATPNGNIPFTAEEELEADREEQVWADGATERAMAELREQRNIMLSETDHYALQDVDLSDEMITYRQALRDLPETVDINNIIYPDKP